MGGYLHTKLEVFSISHSLVMARGKTKTLFYIRFVKNTGH